ncbi:MAG: hypothetical protein R2849_04150 [Thermomicrobiales bacterium]
MSQPAKIALITAVSETVAGLLLGKGSQYSGGAGIEHLRPADQQRKNQHADDVEDERAAPEPGEFSELPSRSSTAVTGKKKFSVKSSLFPTRRITNPTGNASDPSRWPRLVSAPAAEFAQASATAPNDTLMPPMKPVIALGSAGV